MIRLNLCTLDYRDPASGEDCFHHQGLCRIIHTCRPRHLALGGVNVYNLNLGLVRSKRTSESMAEFLWSIERLTLICTNLKNNWYSTYHYRSINELPNLKDITLIIMPDGADTSEARLNLTNFASATLRRLCQNEDIDLSAIQIINIDKVLCEYWHPTKRAGKPVLVEPSDILDKIRDPFIMDLRHMSQMWDEEAWDGSEVEEIRVREMVVEEGEPHFQKIRLVSAEKYVRTKDARDVLEPSEIEPGLGSERA
ncbi:hypothetical protein I302_100429 [Kwoniella bestiolae CBS 10118]|uniref:Uncharacterized protein n=1 Tax=Kwoniella bestiolae CBS 10118 TaxID=1296100 RepID=A0A1B9G549_9TREE|nr:hypothetical protein I302_03805 [Kwoniella bestiolae CBS 10118]OCF26128.1 hypothetical protein I302_03805 [Kwoniella bestiolae CBS 10118]